MDQDVVFEVSGRSLRPTSPQGDRGFFFSTRSRLEPGIYIARYQVMWPSQLTLTPDAFLAFEVLTWSDDEAEFAGRTERPWTAELIATADNILLIFSIDKEVEVEYRCFASHACNSVHLRALKVKRADRGRVEDWSYTHGATGWPLAHLRNVIVGNSSVCNAKCPH